MPLMSKKAPAPEPESGDGSTPRQVNLRLFDPNLLEAIEAYALREYKRGNMRNYAINALLEEILKQKGFWPWPAEE